MREPYFTDAEWSIVRSGINLMKENEMKSCGEDEYNEYVKPKIKSTITSNKITYAGQYDNEPPQCNGCYYSCLNIAGYWFCCAHADGAETPCRDRKEIVPLFFPQ